jgi:hypothetical protein
MPLARFRVWTDDGTVRCGLVLAILALTLALPASAAQVDPRALVLGPADVPSGFRLDREDSGVRSNELEVKEFPETRSFLARWKRVTGYQASYRRQIARIEARADLFRTSGGARALLEWADREWRKSGISGHKRSVIGIGAEGSVYWHGGRLQQTLVLWRHGRVFSGVYALGIPRAKTLALARTQQRRIASALH